MVLVISQLCPSLVSSHRYSFGLFIRALFPSLPVPFPVNIRLLNYQLFSSLPIPFSDNICVSVCSLISSLPDPFPYNSVLLFVLICLVPTHACPRLQLQPNPLVLPPCDSDPRLPLGPVIGFPWTLLFADSRFWTVFHSLKLVPIKNTISLFLNSVWRLVPVTQS